jgi:uncharacterized integral membrane protein
MSTMGKIKIVGAALAAIVLVIIMLQNTQQVETKLLFVTITMPRAVLLFTMLAVGFVLGILAIGRWTRKQAP